jgi:pSer/pThr/pTyr-binding forkhead associated (FHA) protein
MAIIGREALADIVLPFPGVSSRHAHLDPLGAGRYRVADLDSSNGTYVGGRRVRTADVRDGEDLRFGSVSFDWAAHRAALEAELALPRGLVLGRDPSCDIVVADGRVSGRHLRVVPQGTGFLLIDLGSVNGLFVNGRPVSRALVGPADEVRLGTLRVGVPGLVEQRQAPAPSIPPPPVPPVVVPLPAAAPAPAPLAEPPRRGSAAWPWVAAAVVVLALVGTGVAFATRQDVVQKCALGDEEAYRENGVFFWDLKEARARAEQHSWCPRHAAEKVPYTKTVKCVVCGAVIRREPMEAPRSENPHDIEVSEGTCSDQCRLRQDVRDAGAGIKELAGKAMDAFLR